VRKKALDELWKRVLAWVLASLAVGSAAATVATRMSAAEPRIVYVTVCPEHVDLERIERPAAWESEVGCPVSYCWKTIPSE
jgi:hypothetical protein